MMTIILMTMIVGAPGVGPIVGSAPPGQSALQGLVSKISQNLSPPR